MFHFGTEVPNRNRELPWQFHYENPRVELGTCVVQVLEFVLMEAFAAIALNSRVKPPLG